jgi:hypothetical protein
VSARIRCQEPNSEVLCSTVGTDTRVFERGIATGRRMGGDDSVSSVLSLLTSGALRLWPGGRTSVPGHPPPTPNQRADKVSLNSRCILEERPCPLQQGNVLRPAARTVAPPAGRSRNVSHTG